MNSKTKLYSAPYSVLMKYQRRMMRIFERHSLEWNTEEVSEVDSEGYPIELSGVLIGTEKNLLRFFKGAGFIPQFRKVKA